MNKLKKAFNKSLLAYKEKHYNYRGGVNDLAKKLNVEQSHLSNMLANRKCVDELRRREIAIKIGMDYDTMIGIEKPGKQNISYFESPEDKQHFDVTKQFDNKILAIEINQTMVKIEKKDPQRLYEIKRFINHLFAEIQNEKGPEKKII